MVMPSSPIDFFSPPLFSTFSFCPCSPLLFFFLLSCSPRCLLFFVFSPFLFPSPPLCIGFIWCCCSCWFMWQLRRCRRRRQCGRAVPPTLPPLLLLFPLFFSLLSHSSSSFSFSSLSPLLSHFSHPPVRFLLWLL